MRAWPTAETHAETPWPDRGDERCRRLTASAAVVDPPAPTSAIGATADDRPRIIVDVDEHRVNAEAAAALAAEPDVYQRGGILVQVFTQPADADPADLVRRPADAPVVRALPRSLLRERLTRVACWVQERGPATTPSSSPSTRPSGTSPPSTTAGTGRPSAGSTRSPPTPSCSRTGRS